MKTAATFLAFVTVLFPAASVGLAQNEAVPWTARPDPLPFQMPAALSTDKTIPLGKTGTVVYPSTTSPFACVVVPGGAKMPPELRLIDLGRLEQVGQSLRADGINIAGLRASPFGDYIAAVDGKADKPTVKVWSFDGKAPRSLVVQDEKVRIEGLDFAGQGKLLTVKEIRDIKKNLFHRHWEVWDIESGKRVSEFRYALESYDPRWVGFSPGRNYLVMEQNSNDGYFFLIWDLTSGKLAGKLEVQPRKDGFGIAAGISFSPDGKEAALLWRQGEGGHAKIHRFDIEKGVKKGQHVLRDEIKPSSPGFGIGGMTSFQFLPDGRGWLLSGHQIVERESGKVVWKVDPAPGYKNNTRDRRFADPYHVTTLGDKKFAEKKLTLITLPKAELDAAFQQARSK